MFVAVHELIEALLCRDRNVSEADVDRFDLQPLRAPYEEHGDDPLAPYYQEHQFATVIERALAHELDLDWSAYSDRIDAAYDAAAAAKC